MAKTAFTVKASDVKKSAKSINKNVGIAIKKLAKVTRDDKGNIDSAINSILAAQNELVALIATTIPPASI